MMARDRSGLGTCSEDSLITLPGAALYWHWNPENKRKTGATQRQPGQGLLRRSSGDKLQSLQKTVLSGGMVFTAFEPHAFCVKADDY